MSREPSWFPKKVELNLFFSDVSSHPEPKILPATTIFEEKVAGFRVSFTKNEKLFPVWGEDVCGDDNTKQFQIADGQIFELFGRRAVEKSASFVVKSCQPRPAIGPATCASIHAKSEILFLFEEVDTISRAKSIDPPGQVSLDRVVHEGGLVRERRGQTFGGQQPSREKPPRSDNRGGVEKTAAE